MHYINTSILKVFVKRILIILKQVYNKYTYIGHVYCDLIYRPFIYFFIKINIILILQLQFIWILFK